MPGNLALTGCAAAAVVSSRGAAPVAAALRTPGVGGGGGGGASASNWAERITGEHVVWFHNFEADAEVNQFRWTSGFSGGNDPNAAGTGGNFLTRVASGGPDGGGFLRATYPAGNVAGRGGSYWWRPFAALTGAGNGRGANDPGASGAIAPQAFSVTSGSSTLLSFGNVSNPGWYGHASDVAANPTKYQGTDYWLQVRVRRADTPGAPPDAPPYFSITGKNVWLTTTGSSYTAQELVTYGQSQGNGDTVGVLSRHNVYSGQNFTSLGDGQPNQTVALNNLTLDWRYSGGWDTLLYHVTPGTDGGTGSNRTRVEVWAQHDPALFPAESGVYTKIWDVTYSQGFDTGTNSVGAPNRPGWNALILGCYHNGSEFASSFNFDYAQLIFSKAYIPPPVVGWTPPYSLPASGQVIAIGVTSGPGSFYSTAPTSPTNGTMSGANWSYAVFNNYGGGDMVVHYSPGGAYETTGSGGHGVPANVGGSLFDFTDAAWKRRDPAATHGGTTYYRTADYSPGETTGSPHYEITGSNGIPAPAHVQTQCLRWTPVAGSGPLGGTIQVVRAAILTDASSALYAYTFDNSTGLWVRRSTNASNRALFHGSAVYDAARNRYWNLGGNENIFNTVEYLDIADWTFKQTASFGFTQNDQEQGCAFMYQGLLLRHGAPGSLMCFDPDNASAGWSQLTVTGGPLPGSHLNRWIFFPPNGKFYKRDSTAADAVLYRLTPPASNPKTNAWTVDTVTLGSSLPRTTLDGDPSDQAQHYTCLMYVPSIQRLAWIPGGGAQVYLIHPGA